MRKTFLPGQPYKSAKIDFLFRNTPSTMLSGRGVLRRTRHRRVLSKHFKRSGSFVANESQASDTFKIPLYVSLAVSLSSIISFGIRRTAYLFFFIYILRRIGVFAFFRNTCQAYRSRPQQHGPTLREKCLYYVDYWMSTHSYVFPFVVHLTQSSIFDLLSSLMSISFDPPVQVCENFGIVGVNLRSYFDLRIPN